MSYEVREPELKAVSALDESARYDYFVNKVADWEEIWSVGDKSGWAMYADDSEKELIPVWPASAYAAKCCTDSWEGHKPKKISLEDWLDKWTPGMAADGRLVVVFPLPNDKGVIVSPERLESDLSNSMSQYE